MKPHLHLFLFFWGVVQSLGAPGSGPVSFFGASHVSVRIVEARSYSDIFFRIRTRRADSMLFLAAGRTDYCLLVLDAGRLKVHINLGAGETEIGSEAPFLLNDMAWHSVNLTRRGASLSLLVDNHLTKGTLPSRFHELNIHFGVWLGGLAGFNEIFLGNLPSFRGCLSDVSYNGEDLLLKASKGSQGSQVSGVSWNCSDEFDAGAGDPFTLTETGSYLIARLALSRSGTAISLSLSPLGVSGLVFYVSGLSSRPDYVALELREGVLRLVAEMGSGPLVLTSTTNISTPAPGSVRKGLGPVWHVVAFQVSPYSLSLRVDNETLSVEAGGRGSSRHLDVSELVYLGVEESRRTKLRQQGLIDFSFRGCIKELVVDAKGVGLPQADVTSNITTRCGGGGVGTDDGSSHELVTISRSLFRLVTRTELGELEILRVTPLQVAEGDSTLLTPRHLAVTLDLAKFGIRESGVIFQIKGSPQQGRIEVTKGASGGKDSFSLLDMGAGRVRYWHNGQESSRDALELVLQLLPTAGFLLPAYLQDERLVTLPIEVTAVNDPPEIRLVPGGVLRLAEGTKIRLSADVVSSLDPDTPPEELTFTLLSTSTLSSTGGGDGDRGGHLELDSGKPIRNFTQADLLANRLWYVDGGESSSKLALRVTDGSSVSGTAVLRVETFPLRIAPEVNTGLDVASVQGTSAIISASNLSFTSNAGEQGLVLEYHVVSGPKAGALQLRRSNGAWSPTDTFSQAHLSAGRLRYLLQRPSETALGSEDEFSFHVALAETKVPSEFRFRFRILPLQLVPSGRDSFTLNETRSGRIALVFSTAPLSLPDGAISYKLLSPPSLGTLVSSGPSAEGLTSWTQADGLEGKVTYVFKLTPYSPLTDHFIYNVTATHLESTLSAGPFRAEVVHSTRRKPVTLSLKPLIVQEGGRETLSSKILRLRIAGEGEVLHFNLSSPPAHGRLEKERELRGGGPGPSNLIPADRFSSQDLERGRLFYTHDGSESPRDRLELVAWSLEPESMLGLGLDIIVKGVNNHAPALSSGASLLLHVVEGGSRSITPAVLDYTDGDWDAERAALKYTTRGGSPGIGAVYSRSLAGGPIFTWTQADIDGGNLVFRSEGGASQGVINFWVTDGKFIVNGTLEIRAGPPWVRLGNGSSTPTPLLARRGGVTPLTRDSLRVQTNVEVDEGEIIVRLLDGPREGSLQVKGQSTSPGGQFSLEDMAVGGVTYVSGKEGGAANEVGRDALDFQVEVRNLATVRGTLDIALYPEAYWTPLTIGANRTISVGENSSVVISQTFLHISNPHIPPSDIVYTLLKPPSHGYLAIDAASLHEETADIVSMWDQTVINSGRLRYVQSAPNSSYDSMTFSVTNGVASLPSVSLGFSVIPSTLLLTSIPVSLGEGTSIQLNLTHLSPLQSYFKDRVQEFRVVEGPSHGSLGLLPNPEAPLPSHTFSFGELAQGNLVYSHDGSETGEDSFSVVGLAVVGGDRLLSPAHKVIIRVVATNDQVPQVVNNTGTWVWMGGATPLDNALLAAIDADSEEHQLIFYVVGSRGGFPALRLHPSQPLSNFTQAQLNGSQILFTHRGADTKPAAFEFEVSDGLNEAGKESFKVRVRKPELTPGSGREVVPLSVFPFTRAPLGLENLLVRSTDGREVHFQVSSLPGFGSVVLETSPGSGYVPVSVFSQTNVSSGRVFYQHEKSSGTGSTRDKISLIATSKYADPLPNIGVDVIISVSGAALGGLTRYVGITGLEVKEGGQVAITDRNLNLSAVTQFLAAQHRGNVWSGGLPSLRLQVAEVPTHGWLVESDEHRLRPGAHLLPSLLTSSPSSYLSYLHDDSESSEDGVTFSLWLLTSNASTTSEASHFVLGPESATWLLNITLPIVILPVDDEAPGIVPRQGAPLPVVQGHWRPLSRSDLLVTDPDTERDSIVFSLVRLSHGRLVLLPPAPSIGIGSSTMSPSTTTSTSLLSGGDPSVLNTLPTADRFTQADIEAGRLVLLHSGPLSPIQLSLSVKDGSSTHPPLPLTLSIPVAPLSLTPLVAPSLRVMQGVGGTPTLLTSSSLPSVTNGSPARLRYSLGRPPLHGKLLVAGTTPTEPISQAQLLSGEVAYLQTDLSVSNDSFELAAYFVSEPWESSGRSPPPPSPTAHWLVHVVGVPLLKRVLEVRSFVRGFAVGGLLAPDPFTFSASPESPTAVSLALLDASPLAGLTGSNPSYELLLPPKHGRLWKLPSSPAGGRSRRSSEAVRNLANGRPAGRWSHEDIRRGLLIYIPELQSNELFPVRSTGGEADEFVFKLLAPGVQPAIGIAKFSLSLYRGFDPDKGHTEIISDGSTDPATKRGGGSGSSGGRMRDITFLVTPQLTKDSLLLIGLIIGGVMSLSLFLVLGIRCTCSKKTGRRESNGRVNGRSGGGTGSENNGGGKGGVGIIDAFAHHGDGQDSDGGGLRPLMMSTLSPRNSRNKVSMSRATGSDSGSWTSSNLRNSETPTPSLPQCRVTPLCAPSSEHHTHTLPHHHHQPPICDTFGVGGGEEGCPEQYGFSYGPLPPPLDLPHQFNNYHHHPVGEEEEETAFALLPSNCSTMSRATNTPASNLNSGGGGGTLRKPPKNQYWV